MKRAFREGRDLHLLTATYLNGKRNPEDITPEARQLAKAVNFGLIYGMGAARLADYVRISYGVELTKVQADTLRSRYFQIYSGIRLWHRVQGKCSETRTTLGRRRTFDGAGTFHRAAELACARYGGRWPQVGPDAALGA